MGTKHHCNFKPIHDSLVLICWIQIFTISWFLYWQFTHQFLCERGRAEKWRRELGTARENFWIQQIVHGFTHPPVQNQYVKQDMGGHGSVAEDATGVVLVVSPEMRVSPSTCGVLTIDWQVRGMYSQRCHWYARGVYLCPCVITPRGFTSLLTQEAEYSMSGFISTNKQTNNNRDSINTTLPWTTLGSSSAMFTIIMDVKTMTQSMPIWSLNVVSRTSAGQGTWRCSLSAKCIDRE